MAAAIVNGLLSVLALVATLLMVTTVGELALEMPVLWVAPALPLAAAVTFAVAALAQARAWASRRTIQKIAIAVSLISVLITWSPFYPQIEVGPMASRGSPTSRTTTEGEGIRATFDLQFSGPIAGRLTDPAFLYVIQTCGPSRPTHSPSNYRIHSLIGRVGEERVTVLLHISPYSGPGHYEVGRTAYRPTRSPATGTPASTALPARDVYVNVGRIVGSFFDNEEEEDWESTIGSIAIGPDGRSGSLNIELQPSYVDGRVLRLIGTWTCSEAEYRPPRL